MNLAGKRGVILVCWAIALQLVSPKLAGYNNLRSALDWLDYPLICLSTLGVIIGVAQVWGDKNNHGLTLRISAMAAVTF